MSNIDDAGLVKEVMDEEIEWDDEMDPGIQNLIDMTSLRWIFVGGKGGVGKTTTSCSLAATLAKYRKSVLIISTDPAHNLSDAFSQKIGKNPTKLNGWDNLFAMEVDPTVDMSTGDALDDSSKNLISELASSIPGIDEAMSFAEIMKTVQNMEYETIVFDTAPTGHTLRLLSFPSVLEKGLAKIMAIKSKFSGIFQQMQSMMDQQGTSEEQVYNKLEQAKAVIEQVNQQFQNPELTTFTCVCIPEFLSLFETERLVQELSKYGIDSCNVVVNQVLMPEKDSTCKKCNARVRMQSKYLNQIFDLYEDFHITVVPLLDGEVRGKQGLEEFGQLLLSPPAKEDIISIQQ